MKKRTAKKYKMTPRTLLLSLSAGLLLASGMIFLFLYLNTEPKILPERIACAEAAVDATLFVKETEPTTEPTEPTTEPITYEMQIDLQTVKDHNAANADVIGWVYIQDTPINYPIVQAKDNYYYMDKNWKGQYSFSGSIFADWRCRIDRSENSLLYGHNMGNGTMFHAVKYYKDAEWGNEHLYFEVATLEKRFLYKAVSVNVIYGEEGADFTYWNCVEMNKREYEEFIQNIYDTSTVWYGDTEQLPEFGKDRMIALQTCNSGASDGMRCVLFAQCLGEY